MKQARKRGLAGEGVVVALGVMGLGQMFSGKAREFCRYLGGVEAGSVDDDFSFQGHGLGASYLQ